MKTKTATVNRGEWHKAPNGSECECRKCGRWTKGRINGGAICRECHEATVASPAAVSR